MYIYIYSYVFIYLYIHQVSSEYTSIWANYNHINVETSLEMMVLIGKSSPNGRKIQLSEILYFTQINIPR